MNRGGRPIVAIDLETGGFEPGRHSILAIGCYWQDFCGKEHRLRLLVERERGTTVDPAAGKKNGWVSDEQWLGLGATPLREALELTEEWLCRLAMELGTGKLEPVAHNHAGVDRPFFDYWTREKGLAEDFGDVLSHAWHDSMCALRAAQVAELVPAKDGTSLDAMCRYMGRVRRGGEIVGRGEMEMGRAGAHPYHDAAEDAQLCFDGYHWLTELMRRGKQ